MRLHIVIAVLAKDFLQAFGTSNDESLLVEKMSDDVSLRFSKLSGSLTCI